MTKHLWRIILIVLTFVLTSCTTLPEEIEEFTESYCREHPNSDICKGSYIDSLQQQTIEDLFWQMEQDTSGQTDFCTQFISLSNLDLYDDCVEGMTFFPTDLDGYTITKVETSDETTKNTVTVQIDKDVHSNTYVFTIVLVFINDDIYVEEWDYETIVPFDYLAYLEVFLLGLNSVSLSDQDVCGDYLEPGKGYEQCLLKRVQVLNAQETIAVTQSSWSDREDLEFDVILEITGEDGTYEEILEGSFYHDTSEKVWIDVILPFGISRAERTTILTQLVSDTNDFNIATSVIAMNNFDPQSEIIYTHLREYMIEHDLSVIDYDIEFGSTTFFLELDNGDEYIYEVTWEYEDDAWIMHWDRQYVATVIMELDRILLMDRFLNGMETSAATHDYFCDLFVTEDSTMDCVALRTELWDSSQTLVLGEIDYDLDPIPVEFHILDSSMTVIEAYLYYDLDYVVIENQLYLEFVNERRFFPLGLVDAEIILDELVDDANDMMMADASFCDLYGYLFTDCLDFRSRISADMWTVTTEDLEDEGDGDYTLTLGMYDMSMRLAERLIFELEVFEDIEENPIIMGSILDHILIPPDENYDTLLMAFLEDYFTDTISDQDIYDTYNDGWEFEGLYHRDLILDEDLSYVIDDITWHADMGFTWYEAVVTFTYPDDSFFLTTIKYEIFPGLETDLFRLIFDWEMPSEYTVGLRTDDYLADLADTTITNTDFCTSYAQAYEYDNCLAFRQQFLDGSFTASLDTLSREDHQASFLTLFTDGADHSSTLLMDYHPVHDLMGYPWLMVEIKHPDTELLASFSNSVANGIIYGFNTHGINLTTFCDEFATCGTAFDDITSTVHHLTYGEVKWDLSDYFHPELHAIIQFTYYDGLVETHEYSGTYVIEDEYYIWTLHFIQKVTLE